MWQLPLTASLGQQRLYTLKVQLRTSETKYREDTANARAGGKHVVLPTLRTLESPKPLGHVNNPPITATNRKWLLHKYPRIIIHLLFSPFKSIFNIVGKRFKETNCLQPVRGQAGVLLQPSTAAGSCWAGGIHRLAVRSHTGITKLRSRSQMTFPPPSSAPPEVEHRQAAAIHKQL